MKAVKGFLRVVAMCPRWLPTLIVVALIAYLTLVPQPLGDNDIPLFEGADKVVHFIMFGALSGAVGLDWSRRSGCWTHLSAIAAVVVALTGILSGGVVELLQGSMGLGRSAEWVDMVADTLGAVTGAYVAVLSVNSGNQSSQS